MLRECVCVLQVNNCICQLQDDEDEEESDDEEDEEDEGKTAPVDVYQEMMGGKSVGKKGAFADALKNARAAAKMIVVGGRFAYLILYLITDLITCMFMVPFSCLHVHPLVLTFLFSASL